MRPTPRLDTSESCDFASCRPTAVAGYPRPAKLQIRGWPAVKKHRATRNVAGSGLEPGYPLAGRAEKRSARSVPFCLRVCISDSQWPGYPKLNRILSTREALDELRDDRVAVLRICEPYNSHYILARLAQDHAFIERIDCVDQCLSFFVRDLR
jgi:hypothetical protein